MNTSWLRRFWLLPPLLLALGVFWIVTRTDLPLEPSERREMPVKVRTAEAIEAPLVIRAQGYGATRAVRSWEAVAEVAGQVAWLADQLKDGELVPAGSELLRIDDAPYRLALAQAEAQLEVLRVRERNAQASLTLEQQALTLQQRELARKADLHRKGSLSTALLEEAQREALRAEGQVQNLQNTLALSRAELEVAKAQLSAAELNLAYTRLVAPFDLRITEVKVSQAQYANKGQLLFSADAIDAVEVEARFPIGRLRPLIAGTPVAGPTTDGEAVLAPSPGALGLAAQVRLKSASHTVEWSARVDRVSALIDPQTQTLGVVVVIDEPYRQAFPGQRPALMRNTLVEVELRRATEVRLLVPTTALHDGRLYVLDGENRLQIRRPSNLLRQGGVTAIGDALSPGERVVISSLIPAVEGMLLAPEPDRAAMQRLRQEAQGDSASVSTKSKAP